LTLLPCFPPDSVFLSIIRPLPRVTLFPYTTLFRSQGLLGVLLFLFAAPAWAEGAQPGGIPMDLVFIVIMMVVFYFFLIRPQTKRDRKSTRLNSSHVSISYAVFCLKKKRN